MSADDQSKFEARLRVITRIRKLMALAAGNANQNEADQAMSRVRALADKYEVDIHTLTPLPPQDTKSKLRAGDAVSSKFAGAIGRAMGGTDAKTVARWEKDLKE